MKITHETFKRFKQFESFNPMDIGELEKKLEDLLAINLNSIENFYSLIAKMDIVQKHIFNEENRLHVLNLSDTSHDDIIRDNTHFSQVIKPLASRYFNLIYKKILGSNILSKLPQPYDVFQRNLASQSDLYNEKNLIVQQEIDKVCLEINRLQSSMVAFLAGEKKSVPEIISMLRMKDRNIRFKAYQALTSASYSLSRQIDEKFDLLIELRQTLAKNLGYSNYIEYRFKELKRFEWGQEDCIKFHKAVEKNILPIFNKLLEKRRFTLNLEKVAPYDLSVSLKNREPVKLFAKDNSSELLQGIGKIIKAIDIDLYSFYLQLLKNGFIDIEVRDNKSLSTFMVSFPLYEQASIMASCTGREDDVTKILHEFGHCAHYYLGKNVTPFILQDWPAEIAEAGSMAMEYFGLEELHHYLDKETCSIIKEDKLLQTIDMFLTCAKVDEFQHWLYSHDHPKAEDRSKKWMELSLKYAPHLDHSEFVEERSKGYLIKHILQSPFYFVEYGISEVLAMSLWKKYKNDKVAAIELYKEGCRLAASKTVAATYQAFGTELCFDESVIEPIAKLIHDQLFSC